MAYGFCPYAGRINNGRKSFRVAGHRYVRNYPKNGLAVARHHINGQKTNLFFKRDLSDD